MHPFITKLAVPISGNSTVQYVIQRILFSQFLNYLIGIGAGSDAFASGEKVIFKILKDRSTSAQPVCIFDVGANQGQFLNMTQRCLQVFRYKFILLSQVNILMRYCAIQPKLILM